jgi:hypothetical protein
MMGDSAVGRTMTRRPVLVWIISVLYVVGGLISPLAVYLAVTGHLPLTPARRHFYDGFGTLNYLGIVVTAALDLAFGIQLFRLKASAPYLITALFLVSIAKAFWYWPSLPMTGLLVISRIAGLILSLCIVGYSWNLLKTGRLT